MSNRFSRTIAPLVLELIPSHWLRLIHILVVLVALAAIFCTPFSWSLQITLAAIALGGAFCALPRVQLCRLRFDGQWLGRWRDGRESVLQLDSAVVWPALIVLRFRDTQSPRRSFHAVLLPDSVAQSNADMDGWRRLRVFLHHHDVFVGGEGDPAAPGQSPP